MVANTIPTIKMICLFSFKSKKNLSSNLNHKNRSVGVKCKINNVKEKLLFIEYGSFISIL